MGCVLRCALLVLLCAPVAAEPAEERPEEAPPVAAEPAEERAEERPPPSWTRRALVPDEVTWASEEEVAFPLVLANKENSTLARLTAELEAHGAALRADLHKHGALLLRGFPVAEPADFEAVLLALGLELSSVYKPADATRTQLTQFTFTAADTAGFHTIAPHHEQAYSTRRPGTISFFCHTPPRDGGETPLLRTSGVLDEVSAATLERLRSTRARHRRTYASRQSAGGGRLTLRARLLRGATDWLVKRARLPLEPQSHYPPWQQVFQTEDRAEAAAWAAERRLNLTWDGPEPAARAQFASSVPHIVRHPATGDRRLVWQIHQWSYAAWQLSQRLLESRVPGRLSPVPFAPRARLANGISRLLGVRYVNTFAGGEAVEPALAEELVRAAWRHSTIFRWRRGDVLVIDNVNAMHGRLPTRDPLRRVLASLADVYDVR